MGVSPAGGPIGRRWQQTLVAAWYRGAWWLWLLRPLEAVFRALSALRRGLYRAGLLPVYRAPVPVVVVGNITVGGTGKTPVVIALVESLQQRGLVVGVVSRGYGAVAAASPHRVSADSSARQCGDEPLLIHRRTGCPCVVSPSRVAAVKALLATTPVDLIISDDGLQHYALARQLEIAVLDAGRGTGNGFCLPAGPLREPPARLRSVDHALYRGGDDDGSGFRYEPTGLVNIASGERRPATPDAVGADIDAVAGIGEPGQFFAMLRALGFQLSPHVFPDHHPYTARDFAGMGARPIIMTAKDAVKCEHLAGDNAWALEVDARLPAAVTAAVAALVRH